MEFCFLRYLLLVLFLNLTFFSPVFGMSNEQERELGAIRKTTRLLIAEDDLLLRKMYEAWFDKKLYTPALVSNGHELLESYVPGRFDVILTDGQMPEMGGVEAIERLVRKYGKSNLPPIIAVTGDTSNVDKEKFFTAGANGFIPKPVSRNSLIAEITRLLQGTDTNE